jgi:pyridoxine 5-phosphate synthase
MSQLYNTALSVNLNKIALIRNSREGNYPNVVSHGITCLAAGADGLTVHPRPDQRHIRPQDVYELAELLQDNPAEFNIEGNPFAEKIGSFPGFIQLVLDTKPEQCTLVPDTNDQLTSDHGFDLKKSYAALEPVINQLKSAGVRVSLFMDPIPEQIELAKKIGADRIELYTGPYAAAFAEKNTYLNTLFNRYYEAAVCANSLDIGLNAGHDLNLNNLGHFRQIPKLLEVSIGHALIVDAMAMGLTSAVQAYKKLCTAI